jgi:hypothetical protein
LSTVGSKMAQITIRPLYYRDLEVLENLVNHNPSIEAAEDRDGFAQTLANLKQWYGLLRVFKLVS